MFICEVCEHEIKDFDWAGFQDADCSFCGAHYRRMGDHPVTEELILRLGRVTELNLNKGEVTFKIRQEG